MSAKERDPSPVGDYEIDDDKESEITNHPDNARANDMGMVAEPEDGDAE